MARRETTKNGVHAVTPTQHGVNTAYAVFAVKPLYPLDIIDGVKHGVKHNLSHTPSRAKYYLA